MTFLIKSLFPSMNSYVHIFQDAMTNKFLNDFTFTVCMITVYALIFYPIILSFCVLNRIPKDTQSCNKEKMTRRGIKSDIVMGLCYGDEGKGKVIYHLSVNGDYNFCVRFNGGPNAGHTIVIKGKKYDTHQIPSGALKGVVSLIGPSCHIDLAKLDAEIKKFEEAGFANIRDCIKISYNAHLIQENHIEEDKANEKEKNDDGDAPAVGSTCCGMGPVTRDKVMRKGRRVDSEAEVGESLVGCEVVDPSELLNSIPDADILFEGAQGFMLDINWAGFYPYCTSNSCLASEAFTAGVSARTIRDVWGVLKIYDTYVGAMKFQPSKDESDGELLAKLQILGGEFGVTTGRPRQCNWFNLDRLIQALRVNGVNKLVINKCDIITLLGVYKVIVDDGVKEFESLEEMQNFIQNWIEERYDGIEEWHWSSSPERI